MALRKIQLPDETTVDVNDSRIHIYRTLTGTAAVTADPYYCSRWDVTDETITGYTDGMVVCLKVPVAGNGTYGTGFQINNLGYKPVVYNISSMVSTRYGVGSVVWAVYNSTQTASLYLNSDSATTVTGCWQVNDYGVSDTNSIGYQLRTNSSVRPTVSRTRYYRILFSSADNTKWVPANTKYDNSATSVKPVNTTPINPFGRIVYMSGTTNVSAGSNVGAAVTWDQYALTLGYSFNTTGSALTLTYPAPVYIKCAPQADGSAIIDSTTPYVQALPSTADGKIYIYLGQAYSETQVEMTYDHPIYYHDGTQIRQYSGDKTGASTLSELTDTTITTPSNGQVLTYDNTTSKWINSAAPSGLPSQTGNNGKFLITNGTNASWVNITQDDHKWNDVSLNKNTTYTNGFYVPILSSMDATTANLVYASASPTSYRIAQYDYTGYLSSVTPASGDNSTKVATTAFVDNTISSQKGTSGGIAELDSNGKVPSSQLPSYVDDVLEYASQSAFPSTGESGKIYIAQDTNKTYRWSGSAYVEISESLALGETSSTAYRGDRGKTAYDHSQITNGSNPHNTTLSGLTDTTISSPTNGQILKYDNTSSKWVNSDVPTEVLACTLTITTTYNSETDSYDISYSCDKTAAEIYDAYTANKSVFLKTTGDDASGYGGPVTDVIYRLDGSYSGTGPNSNPFYFIFFKSQISLFNEVVKTAIPGVLGRAFYNLSLNLLDGDLPTDLPVSAGWHYLSDELIISPNIANGNLPQMDGNNINDSGISATSVSTAVTNSHTHSNKTILDYIPSTLGTAGQALIVNNNATGLTFATVGGGGGLTNYDFTHVANTTVSTSTTTITFAANQRGSQMITVSADIGITFDVRNLSDNYLWIKNTGSSEIDVTISSVVNDQTTVSNVYVPTDGISVPAGGVCEIGIVRNADGAFITSRNDLEL